MKGQDLVRKTDTDLTKMLREKRENYRNFRFNISGSKTRDVKSGMKVRREIAQILTELNRRKSSAK